MMIFLGNFLQPDGSIKAELDFSVRSAKFCKDDEGGEQELRKLLGLAEKEVNTNMENAGKEADKK